MYKKLIDPLSNSEVTNCIIKLDGLCIPFDPDNTDYQEYLEWLAEGNEVLPADEPTAE
jgi:hypothetical protein